MAINLTKKPIDIVPFFNGSFRESFNALVTSDGATITLSLEQAGGGNLTMQFSDGQILLDCTPAVTIELTAGSIADPQANYIYIPQSTKILTKSTTEWPSTEHIKVGYFLVQTAAYVQSDGALINQNWNDHLQGTDGQGHMLHMAERIRRQGSVYFSGIEGAGVDDYTTSAAGSVTVQVGEGIVYQMHKQTFTAKDTSSGDDIHVVNASAGDGGAYTELTNLYDIDNDSAGGTLTNKYFNIVLWGVVNKTGEYSPLMCNLPSGSYNTQTNAENDVDGYDDFSIPRAFKLESSTGFLIARMTFRKAGGSWTYFSTIDLRGSTPTTAKGSGGAGEANTASNVGTGVSLFKQKSVVDLEFNNIKSENGLLSVALDGVTNDVELTVNQASIDHGSIAGLSDDDHTQYLLADGSRALTSDWDAGIRKIQADYMQTDIQHEILLAGSTTAFPHVLRFTGFVPNTSAQIEFGDPANAIYADWGGALQMGAYHSIVLRGDRNSSAQLAASTESSIGVLVDNTTAASKSLVVRGASGQSGKAFEIQDSGSTRQFSIKDNGTTIVGSSNSEPATQLHVEKNNVNIARTFDTRETTSFYGGPSGTVITLLGDQDETAQGSIWFADKDVTSPLGRIRYQYNSNFMYFYVSGKIQMAFDGPNDNVGIGTLAGTPSAKLHVDQWETSNAIPVLLLDQADLSEEFVEFTSTVGTGNPIEAVGAKTLTTTHFIRISITGVGYRYIPVGTIA